ncbi:hypothetical protein GUITHDRAFT_154151 [Guillardia theta CCMP2712]|uniref:Uncharacterized protein n=1 Tax=Guillardia theta (strain CCMP2712) TaxID=905079 RepID=L1IW59_GUITC|nr:hypothetical protein GUITHDRAFT_154151 [Guillardia theta CCMP2712]EKX40312.1 hypothetical protein GUITHDRAFT_154151 [Guillardia theta CCMP2712]|eukprot:XP_005827292.1 hypothetical protein GUITHDRAFT_154151 [Guillardia theta CCMP2712]
MFELHLSPPSSHYHPLHHHLHHHHPTTTFTTITISPYLDYTRGGTCDVSCRLLPLFLALGVKKAAGSAQKALGEALVGIKLWAQTFRVLQLTGDRKVPLLIEKGGELDDGRHVLQVNLSRPLKGRNS